MAIYAYTMKFKERLKAIRVARGFTQAELALRIKLPAAMISHYETGVNKPGLDNLIALIKALGCDPNDLLK